MANSLWYHTTSTLHPAVRTLSLFDIMNEFFISPEFRGKIMLNSTPFPAEFKSKGTFFLCFPEAEVLELSVGNMERKSGGSKANRQGNEKQESPIQINNQINAQFYTNRGGSEKCWDVTIDGTF